MPSRSLAVILALWAALVVPAPARAQDVALAQSPTWAPAASATIRPGVRVSTSGGGCTSNFVFFEPHPDPAGGPTTFDVYVGLAAHCYSLGASNQTNGCTTPSRPLGTATTVSGAAYPARLAYSSWLTMQSVQESDGDACAVNDFALARLDRRDHAKVNPTVLHFGGPTGARTTATRLGDEVYTYGNSPLRLGIRSLLPKWGYSIGSTNQGWNHRVYTATPGIPGDSGSGMLDAQGRAMGVVVTLAAAPFPASNGVTDITRAMGYLRARAGLDIRLATGTQPFTPNRVPPPPQ